MRSLSVAIITFNEERNIERCIRSVLSVADEVVLMDSNSTDHTVAIAKAMGAKVYTQSFLGHIEQKNSVIKYTSNDFVLSIDADEWLDEPLIRKIAEIKQNGKSDGYIFNRLNRYCGQWIRHGAWYPDKKLRLWDKNKGAWGGINPHDEFRMNASATIEYIPLNICHQSYISVDEHLKKSEYFSDLAAEAYFAKGKKSDWFRITFSPLIRFLRDYVILQGFRDGYYGWIIARNTAIEVRKKYLKLYQLQRQHRSVSSPRHTTEK